MPPLRVLLVGLRPIVAEILERYLATHDGFEKAGAIAGPPSAATVPSGVDVMVLGGEVRLSEAERSHLFVGRPDLVLIAMSRDERSICSCRRGSPEDVLHSIRAVARA